MLYRVRLICFAGVLTAGWIPLALDVVVYLLVVFGVRRAWEHSTTTSKLALLGHTQRPRLSIAPCFDMIRKLSAQFTRPNREPCNDTVVCVAPAAETTRPPRQRTKTPSTSIEIDGPQRTPRHNPKPARSFILGACDRPTSGFSCGALPLCMTGSHSAPPLRPPMTLTLLGLAFESKHQSVEVSGSCTKRCS